MPGYASNLSMPVNRTSEQQYEHIACIVVQLVHDIEIGEMDTTIRMKLFMKKLSQKRKVIVFS